MEEKELNNTVVPSQVTQAPVKNHMVLAIFAIIMFWPLGIPAIINAAKVKKLQASGDSAGAEKASKSARLFGLIGVIVSAVMTILFAIILILGVVGVVAGIGASRNFIVGNWKQTAAGLYFSDSPGPEPDYIEVGKDGKISWYSNAKEKSKDYMVGEYTIEYGNKTNNNGQIKVGEMTMYTMNIKPQYYLDENGERKTYTGSELQYLIYLDPKDTNTFMTISAKSIRGYKFERD